MIIVPKFFSYLANSLSLLLFLCIVAVAQPLEEEKAKPDSPDFKPPHRETILSYDSDIRIAEDGKLTVTTTIKVWAMGREIKRGIYRKFPVKYTGRMHETVRVPFDVLSVKRDGRPEPYHFESEDFGVYKVLYIGNKDKRLTPNQVYTYEITYQTNRQLGYFDDFDELYWNVNGTEWGFPIDKISAVVTLPKQVSERELRIDGYTGAKGAKGKNFRSWVDKQGRVHFETTQPMPPETGLTIAVGFPKNIVQPPSESQQLAWFFTDNAGLFGGAVALLAVLVYYFLAWLKVGRDPPRGVIYPRYVPPKFNGQTLSPAGVAYVNQMKKSKECITASMINFAVCGGMTISEDEGSFLQGKSFTLQKTEGDTPEQLQSHESKAFRTLFRSKDKVEVKQKNHSLFQSFKKTLLQGLKNDYCGKDKLFITNTGWFIFGILVSLGAMGFAALGELISGNVEAVGLTLFLTLWLSIWTVVVFALVVTAVAMWKNVLSNGPALIIPALGATAFAVPFFIGEVVAIGVLFAAGSFLLAMTGLLIGVLNYFFFKLLKQPTAEGARVRDEIEGLKMYLAAAEEDDLQRSTPEALGQKDTPEIFEAYLPYAIALGVEVAWTKRFENILSSAAIGETDGGGYRPRWYSGSAFNTAAGTALTGAGLTGAIGGLAGGFSSALSSAGTSPGSSSGSSGGGSSGGGGGGGGGGGW